MSPVPIPAASDSLEVGPQSSKDPAFTARYRLHQSWYRAHVLQAPYGVGPKPTNSTPLGSMLTREDGERGLNFLSPHIHQVARRRLAEGGGLLDSFRLLCNLLSPEALAFNLLGPWVDNQALLADLTQVMAPLGKAPVRDIQKVFFEWTPEPVNRYLGVPQSFNGFLAYERRDRSPGFLAVETRLTEPPPAKRSLPPIFRPWLEAPNHPWQLDGAHLAQQVISDPELYPIFRSHLLAWAVLRNAPYGYRQGCCLYLYHPQDAATHTALQRYAALLKPDQSTFCSLALDQLLERWVPLLPARPSAQQWQADFTRRYLDLSLSAGVLPPSRVA